MDQQTLNFITKKLFELYPSNPSFTNGCVELSVICKKLREICGDDFEKYICNLSNKHSTDITENHVNVAYPMFGSPTLTNIKLLNFENLEIASPELITKILNSPAIQLSPSFPMSLSPMSQYFKMTFGLEFEHHTSLEEALNYANVSKLKTSDPAKYKMYNLSFRYFIDHPGKEHIQQMVDLYS